jgi:CRISPR-associated protein Cas5t
MRVSRIVVETATTSFRHPFFVTGRQPSFDFPPPSTIFGHVASALGRWPDPRSFSFGLHFTYRARSRDLEHQHIASALPPRTKSVVSTPTGPARATTEVTVQPVQRDFLFGVRMTLYLPTNLGAAFRAPVHTLVLGRSQDLAEVVELGEVDLERPIRSRIEHTLLPRTLRPCVRFGTTVLLSRYIAEPPAREATFTQYIALHEPVFYGDDVDPNRAFIRVEGAPLDDLWVDPDHLDDDGFARGVWIHRLMEPM